MGIRLQVTCDDGAGQRGPGLAGFAFPVRGEGKGDTKAAEMMSLKSLFGHHAIPGDKGHCSISNGSQVSFFSPPLLTHTELSQVGQKVQGRKLALMLAFCFDMSSMPRRCTAYTCIVVDMRD